MTGAPELSRNNGIAVGRVIHQTHVLRFEERFEIATNKTTNRTSASKTRRQLETKDRVENNDRAIRIRL